MSLFTDQYLIEYLIQNGYSKEELDNDTFDISSLSRGFVVPLDLDKVTNIDEIKSFFCIPIIIEVSEETIKLGKVMEVSKYLADYTLTAKEQGLKLDKLYIQDIDLENEVKIPSRITLEGFDLSKINYIYGNTDKMQEILLKNCKSIDLSKLESENLFLVNCSDITTTIERSYNNFALDGYEENPGFLNQVTSDVMQIINLKELDLASLRKNKSYHMRMEDISKCYLSEDVELNVAPYFINVNFDNRFNKQAIIKKNCTIENCSMSSKGKMLSVDKDIILTNEDTSILDSVETENTIFLDDMEVDWSIEKLMKFNKEKVVLRHCMPKDGYDMRRLKRILDLDSPDNIDILSNPGLLSQIVTDNEIVETIGVVPNLSKEHKAILEEKASQKDYAYGSLTIYREEDDRIFHGKELDNFQKPIVTFGQYKEAEEIYDKIIEGISFEWDNSEYGGEIYKFKYLYNELGKLLSYDYNAHVVSNDENEDLYKADVNSRNVFSAILNKKSKCSGIAIAYQYLCAKAGLDCSVAVDYHINHTYNIIRYDDKSKGVRVGCYCDLTNDLENIKIGAPCEGFALESYLFNQRHPGTEVASLENEMYAVGLWKQPYIDQDMGLCSENGEYNIQKYIDMAKRFSEIENVEDRTNVILQNMMELGNLRHMTNHEVVRCATRILLGAYIECNVAHVFARNNKEDTKDIRGILWVKDEEKGREDNEYLYYVFNEEQQAFKFIDKELLEELLSSGMLEFYADTELPGFEYWGSEKQMQQQTRNTGFNR